MDAIVPRKRQKGASVKVVDNLVPHGSYSVSLQCVPLWVNGTIRGYYSDPRFTELVMPEDVPARNPEILPAFENIVLSSANRDVIVYLAPIEEKYRNGGIYLEWTLGGETARLPADESALRISGLNRDNTYDLVVWAVNGKMNRRNESLANTTLVIQRESGSELLLSSVQAVYQSDGKTIRVTIMDEMKEDVEYYIVYCQLDMSSKTCQHYPITHAVSQRETVIALSAIAKPNTHRFGAFGRRVTTKRKPARRSRRGVKIADNVPPSSLIVWSPCLYNLTSVPKQTLVEITACNACIYVKLKELPCDDTGVKIDAVMVKVSGPKHLTMNVTKSKKISVSPGHYTVSARAASPGGLGPEVERQLAVIGPEEGPKNVYVIITVALIFVALCIVAIGVICNRRMSKNIEIKTPHVDAAERGSSPRNDKEIHLSLYDTKQTDNVYDKVEDDWCSTYYTTIPECQVRGVGSVRRERLMPKRPLPEIPKQPDSDGSFQYEFDTERRFVNATEASGECFDSKCSSGADSGIARDSSASGTGMSSSGQTFATIHSSSLKPVSSETETTSNQVNCDVIEDEDYSVSQVDDDGSEETSDDSELESSDTNSKSDNYGSHSTLGDYDNFSSYDVLKMKVSLA